MKKISLHNHSKFSDGRLPPKVLVEFAIECKFDVFAVTDHYEYFSGFFPRYRSDIHAYFRVIAHMKEKYKDMIKLLGGFEIDIRATEYADLPLEFLDNIDILLFERVLVMDDLQKLIEYKKELPMRVGLAHPVFNGFPDLKRLVSLLEKHDIFVELNTSCFEFYSVNADNPLVFETQESFFKLLKGTKVKISVGADIHDKSAEYMRNIGRAYAFIKKLKLEKHLIV